MGTIVKESSKGTLYISETTTIKAFKRKFDVFHELKFYELVPFATPTLIDARPELGQIVIETGTPLSEPDEQTTLELWQLLYAMHAKDVHHRDVHIKNVVKTLHGVRLIDWETAIVQPSIVPYDIYGPDASGVPIPTLHTETHPLGQFWYSDYTLSISRWGLDYLVP